MVEGTERKLAAIVSADVVGYSRLMGLDEAGTHARLKARFRDFVEPKISEHRGRVVKLMGDGLLAEFPSVVDAVNWAVEVQTEVAQLNNNETDDKRIEYRVGVNLGDIIVDGEDIFGNGVNVAARLQEIAEPGGIAISDIVQGQIRDKQEAEFSDAGVLEMKNIAQPVHVWRWPTEGSRRMPTARAPAADMKQSDKPSIAVLPFDNMSSDPEQDFFGDGLAEDITSALAHLRWLFVIARNSAFTYKGTAVDVKQIGRELGVRFVLEGSVRKAGNRIRITAQLIDAVTGDHVWTERYDRVLEDIFEIQDEITRNIASIIEPEILTFEHKKAERRPLRDLDAWERQVRGWHCVHSTTRETAQQASEIFRGMMVDYPEIAAGHAGWVMAQGWKVNAGWLVLDKSIQRQILAAANKAVELDRSDAENHIALLLARTISGDYDGGIKAGNKALELNPSSALARLQLGYCLCLGGLFEAAIETLEEAKILSCRS